MTIECHNCGRSVSDGYALCGLCVDMLIKELKAVPGIVSDMTITRARLDRMSRGRNGGKSAETALPIRLDKYDRRPTQRPLDLLAVEIITWARDIATLTGEDLDAAIDSQGLRQMVHNHHRHRASARTPRDPAALSAEPAYDVELAAIWLIHYPEAIRRHPALAELHDGITDVIAHARKAVDRLPELAYKGPCPHTYRDEEGMRVTCSTDLYAERGEEYVSCPRCWTHHSVRQLDGGRLHRIDNELFSLAELVPLLKELGEPVPKSTLYAWANDPKRKRLTPQGWRQADGTVSKFWMRRPDPALYRLGEVRELRRKSLEQEAS